MQRIVIASNNQGKIRELNELLKHLPYTIVAQAELGVNDIEETGLSFVENSILKARHAAQQTGLPALADDSGLEVDYLNGAPGIYSARYSGIGATDQKNIEKLLEQLINIPQESRTARFQCLAVLMRHKDDPTPLICQGTWEGEILVEPQGSQGFGYDPIFYVPSLRCSAAELSNEQKNQYSHRAKAFRALIARLT